MIPYLGDFVEDDVVYIMFNTFTSDDPSASSTITNFINTDVHIHKDDGLTQRNNAAGITVSVNFDGITGSHLIKIDTNDDTVGGFWVTGHDYFVRIEGTTVDAATVNAVVGHFSIQNRYTRGTDSASLAATALSDVTWTDAKAVHLDANISSRNATTPPTVTAIRQEMDTNSVDFNSILEDLVDIKGTNFAKDTHSLKNILDDVTGLNGSAMIGTNGANTTTPPTVGAIRTEMEGAGSKILAIEGDTNELQTDWVNGGRLDLILDIIASDTTTDIPTKILKYTQLLARNDAAIATDNATELTAINADGGSGAGDFSNQADAIEALRDRGDSAWVTGGGAINDILNIQTLIPYSIDLANTATVRIGLGLTNMVDDLPSTAEITPGTITIDRKAIGGTSWINKVNAAACSELAGLIYYDEVFDTGTGYVAGDSIRITFKSQKITVTANDFEITGTDGWVFQTHIREAMVGAAPTVTAIRQEMDTNSTKMAPSQTLNDYKATGFSTHDAAAVKTAIEAGGSSLSTILADTGELQTDWVNGGRLDLLIDLILGDTAELQGNQGNWSTATSVTVSDKTGFALSAAGVDAILDENIEGTHSMREMMRLFASMLVGKVSGGGTTQIVFRDIDDSKNRIVMTVTDVGNRTDVVLTED